MARRRRRRGRRWLYERITLYPSARLSRRRPFMLVKSMVPPSKPYGLGHEAVVDFAAGVETVGDTVGDGVRGLGSAGG
jgi:hypothetical protein